MKTTQQTGRWIMSACLVGQVMALSLLLGCSTAPSHPKAAAAGDEIAGRLRAGDELSIRVDAGAANPNSTTPVDVIIDDEGYISMSLIGRIKAAGLSTSELADSIQANYVPRFYVHCTVTVLAAARFFYMGGEVRNPNRFLWSEDTTLMKAISTAGGFTDYANRRKVELVRGNSRSVYDCEEIQRNPSKDAPLRPGDTITVPRSIF